MISYTRMRVGLALLSPREVPGAVGRCPFCGLTLFVRPDRQSGPHGIRCAECSAGLVQMSIGWALHEEIGPLGTLDVYELSAHGAVAAHLRRTAKSVAMSEYFAGKEPGSLHDGVRVEDVQRLTYADASFDLVTHCDVLEHVPDDIGFLRDAAALAETVLINLPLEDNWLNAGRSYGPTDVSGHLRKYGLTDGFRLVAQAGLEIAAHAQVWIHETPAEAERRTLRVRHLGADFSGGWAGRTARRTVFALARRLPSLGRRLFASNLFIAAHRPDMRPAPRGRRP